MNFYNTAPFAPMFVTPPLPQKTNLENESIDRSSPKDVRLSKQWYPLVSLLLSTWQYLSFSC